MNRKPIKVLPGSVIKSSLNRSKGIPETTPNRKEVFVDT